MANEKAAKKLTDAVKTFNQARKDYMAAQAKMMKINATLASGMDPKNPDSFTKAATDQGPIIAKLAKLQDKLAAAQKAMADAQKTVAKEA